MLYYRFYEKRPVFDPIWPLNAPGKLRMVFIIIVSPAASETTIFVEAN
jgi:hypothetical protein